MNRQPWLISAKADGLFILSPMILPVLAVVIWRDGFSSEEAMPVWVWVALILCVDVAHVYSTLFRTYFNPRVLSERPGLYFAVPLGALLGGIFLCTLDPAYFWRVLAYLAVFHFIRQQYGLMRMYSRMEDDPRWSRILDGLVIYLATLYPIVFWHAHLPREFHWFIDGDFAPGLPVWVSQGTGLVYVAALCAWLAKTVFLFRNFNLPKTMVVLGTAMSWYVGIVHLNADLAFTFTNVLTHGLPYVALIWFLGREMDAAEAEQPVLGGRLRWAQVFSVYLLPLFLGTLLLLAYLEEGLWASLVWGERLAAFPIFSLFPRITDASTLSWLVPLLALPQATHYILDGFIWRKSFRLKETPYPGPPR